MKISPHIQDYEVKCPWSQEVKLIPWIINLFESVRTEINQPIFITSGYRSPPYQTHLTKITKFAAIMSPHPKGAALDMGIPFNIDPIELALKFQEHSNQLKYGVCRFGLKKYKFRFLHVDIIYMLYKPWTNVENPKPSLWREGVNW